MTSGTVLLHLLTAAVGRRTPTDQPCKPIPALYIPVPSPFSTLEDFIYAAADAYHLELFHYGPDDGCEPPSASQSAKGKGIDMKHALAVYKERFPHIEAILIGTRRTDPHGGTMSLCIAIMVANDYSGPAQSQAGVQKSHRPWMAAL